MKARGLAGAADVADRDGFNDPGAWLAAQTATTPKTTRPAYKLGVKLRHHEATAGAYRDGAISTEHARAVLDSVDKLPADLGVELIGSIEATLVGFCGEHTPPEIRRLGAPAVAARLLPQPGNLSRADSWRLELPPGTYSYSLCAVDSALHPGPKATGTFTVGAAPNIFADGFETGGTGRWFMTVP